MIPAEKPAIISTLGDTLETQEFTVQVDDKAFSLLFDGLYSDKEQSVIRELASNALDAHVAAGVADKPFTVIIPTYLNPVFSVRDYGISLDHDDVMHMYSTVFQSSKQESNDMVGCFGLGSKSPFAYTDSFTAYAYKDGVKRTYLVGLNAKRVPTITFLGSEESSEPTGFEVSFPVKDHDCFKFETAARRVFAGFDVTPETNITYSPPTVALSGEGWTIYKTTEHQYGFTGKAYVRQGCVLYPIDALHETLEVSYRGTDCYIVIDVPIGSVEVSASRESLSMDDRTEKVVEEAALTVRASIKSLIDTRVQNATSMGEACNVVYGFRDFLSRGYSQLDNYTYKGRKLRDQDQIVLDGYVTIAYRGSWTNRTHNTPVGRGPIKFNKRADAWSHTYVTGVNAKGKSKKAHSLVSYSLTNPVDPDFRLILDDGTKVPRVNLRLKEFNQTYGFWLLGMPHTPALKKDIAKIVKALDLKPNQIIRLADLPDVTVDRNPATKTTIYKLSQAHWDNTADAVLDPETDPEKFYWMPIRAKSGPVVVKTSKMTDERTFTIKNYKQVMASFESLTRMFDVGRPVYYVTSRMKKSLGWDDDNRLDLVCEKLFDDNIEDFKNGFREGGAYGLTEGRAKLLGLPWANGTAKRLPDHLFGIVAKHDDVIEWRTEGTELAVETLKKYPLIEALNYSASEEDVDVYIKAMDCYNSSIAASNQSED